MNARAESPYDACMAEAAALSRAWVPVWLTQLHDTLQQRETVASSLYEKQSFSDARVALARHRELLATRFLDALGEVLQSSATGEKQSAPRKKQALSFDDLELMDDQQVQETVDLARVQQVVKMAADDELAAFSARLSRAQGLDVVRLEANPLRPEEVVSALMRALATLHLSEPVRSRWLHTGAVSLGEALQVFYQQLTRQLERLGVEPAGYAVIQAPESRGVPASGAVARSDSVPATSLIGNDALLTLDHLHQLLVGNLEQTGAAVSDQGASGSGNAMVRTLAAEVVTLLLRRIAEDNRLLGPVREMVQDLKAPLLQLARSDPRFFADRQNPARRLLDAITARSLAFTSEQDAGFRPFAGLVHEIVQGLQTAGPELPDRFPEMLQRFNDAQAAIKAPARGLAVQTLVRVEQRNLLAERVAAELEARNDFARAPGVVRRFLQGPWAQVVAHARLEVGGEADMPGDAAALCYMDILPDLLWSSQLALASRNRPRLIKVIPHILRTLREGLDAIEYPRAQAEAFFQALMGLHEAAYKAQHSEQAAPGDSPSESRRNLAAEPWMHAVEARDSGFLEDADLDTRPSFVDTEPMPSDWHANRADSGHRPEPLLPVGTWVDLEENGRQVRCQLNWASPHGTMFLFTGAHGRSISLTRGGLERLRRLGRLRVVADHGVVDEALDEVARQAWLNSAKA